MKSMKTNKSYTKRLKIPKRGKLIARSPGHNHFNARASGQENLRKGRPKAFKMSNKAKARFIV